MMYGTELLCFLSDIKELLSFLSNINKYFCVFEKL